MGERKGQNKYYPPDYDPRAGGLNKFLGTHALRERAKKIHLGIIIIRFEMPYNIWCEGCKNHIGMGKCVCYMLKYSNSNQNIAFFHFQEFDTMLRRQKLECTTQRQFISFA